MYVSTGTSCTSVGECVWARVVTGITEGKVGRKTNYLFRRSPKTEGNKGARVCPCYLVVLAVAARDRYGGVRLFP